MENQSAAEAGSSEISVVLCSTGAPSSVVMIQLEESANSLLTS
jgi:hypothetical protein